MALFLCFFKKRSHSPSDAKSAVRTLKSSGLVPESGDGFPAIMSGRRWVWRAGGEGGWGVGGGVGLFGQHGFKKRALNDGTAQFNFQNPKVDVT